MTFPAAASSLKVPVTLTTAVSAMSPVTTHSSRLPLAVSPVTAGSKQPLTETVPSEKPSASMNVSDPVVVAANVSTSLVAVFSVMPPEPARTPSAEAVIVPPD